MSLTRPILKIQTTKHARTFFNAINPIRTPKSPYKNPQIPLAPTLLHEPFRTLKGALEGNSAGILNAIEPLMEPLSWAPSPDPGPLEADSDEEDEKGAFDTSGLEGWA